MSTVTRRFTITADRTGHDGKAAPVTLGTGVEFDGKDILITLDVMPTGNWWGGVAVMSVDGMDARNDHTVRHQFDLVAGKRGAGAEGKTKWIKVGHATEFPCRIALDMTSIPAGNWWDGKLRLFAQKPKDKGAKP